MLRPTLIATAAALLGLLCIPGIATARGHSHHHFAFGNDNGLLVDNQTQNFDNENEDDVASVGEPVTARYSRLAGYRQQYVPVNDTIVTPYGYAPQYNNGYYQGYGYNPQYGVNPYYAGAAYGNGDPVSTAVITTVLNAASSGGHVSGRQLVQLLVGGYLAAQTQQQYAQYPQQYGQYPQQYGQYPQQYGQYPQQYGQYPQQYAPVYVPNGVGRWNGANHNDENDNENDGGDGD
ncbi:MAG: hypothetical protein NVS9B12_07300 [Vulcanimicrobiaceae bacterium]